MDLLSKIAKKHQGSPRKDGTDKGSGHSYIEIYEEILSPYRLFAGSILEIGIAAGGSLRMWEEYFGKYMLIWGLDNQIKHTMHNTPRIYCSLGDSTEIDKIPEIIKRNLYWVIIDDGDHKTESQIATFDNLFPLLLPGGIYVIEDVTPEDLHKFEALRHPYTVWDLRHLGKSPRDILICIKKGGTSV